MLRVNQAADHYGVCPKTIRRWADSGQLPCTRTIGGHRLFDVQKFTLQKDAPVVIAYCRVSSAKQSNDLQRQREHVKQHCADKFASCSVLEMSDIASGLNFKRKGLQTLLDTVLNQNIQSVVVASRDRLCRFGFELIEHICKRRNTNIVVLQSADTTP